MWPVHINTDRTPGSVVPYLGGVILACGYSSDVAKRAKLILAPSTFVHRMAGVRIGEGVGMN